jgi:hypothetical protein
MQLVLQVRHAPPRHHAGRLSADADGRLDTAELLRAGYMLQRSVQQDKGGADRKLKRTVCASASAARPRESPRITRQQASLAWGVHARLAPGGRSAPEQGLERRRAAPLRLDTPRPGVT